MAKRPLIYAWEYLKVCVNLQTDVNGIMRDIMSVLLEGV